MLLLHGVAANVSPMKQGKRARYFDGKLTDGETQIRIVGFQGELRSRLASYQEKQESVALVDCKVKRGRSEELEVVLKSSSSVASSTKKFSIGDISAIGSSEIQLKALNDRNVYDKVCVSGKVIRVQEPVKVSGGFRKQDVTLADSTAAARITLWEADIGRLEDGQSHRLTDVVVQSYQRLKYLSVPKQGATICKIEDIGKVADDDIPENFMTASGVTVVGVMSLGKYLSCLACKKKVNPTTEKLGKCTNCSMVQCIDQCKKQLSAKLVFSLGADYLKLNVFGSNIVDIACQEDAFRQFYIEKIRDSGRNQTYNLWGTDPLL